MTDNDEPDSDVTELTGHEGGVWRVVTQGSSHILDLDHGTITRIPGLGSRASINDVERPLLDLGRCEVGARGYWRMMSDSASMSFYWHDSSVIRRIERMQGEPDSPVPGPSDYPVNGQGSIDG
jgi:hypothetical protein